MPLPDLTALTTDARQPLRQGRFVSPLRDERVAAWLGAPLGTLFLVCFVTGLYSHVQQHPLPWLPIPASPAGLYRVTQGVHVASGIASMPLLVAKLWVVWPRFLSWPPFRTAADIVERLGLLALVGGGVFMVFSGIADIAQWYPWRFSFTATHYWVAWITIGGIVAHLGAKWTVTRRALGRPISPEPAEPVDPVDPVDPAAPAEPAAAVGAPGGPPDGLTRRGFLGVVAGASGALTVVTVGQTLPLPGLAQLAVLAPRDPRQRPVNRSAANAGVIKAATSSSYRLEVGGRVAHPLTLTLEELLALPAHRTQLPIACVEGWSYSAPWSGVRVRDLVHRAGGPPHAAVQVESLEQHSPYRVSFLDHFQVAANDTLLATHLDGRPLSLDHGYPLRLIAPDRAGVLQTKWVTRVVVL